VSEPIKEPPISPDYLEISTQGRGTKRLNNVPRIALMAVLSTATIAFVYAVSTNDLNLNREPKAEEISRNLKPAEPPITRPSGPDVQIDPAVMVYSAEASPQAAPVREDEMEKQMRARKLADLEAAYKAPTGLDRNRLRPANGNLQAQLHGVPGTDGLIPPPPPAQGNYEGSGEYEDINQQQQKKAFQNERREDNHYLLRKREAPLSPYEIKAGAIIPGVMIGGVNSDLPGIIIGQVRQDVYDSATGQHLLIPSGSRLVGTYDSAVSGGQERVLVAWNRIIYPDSSSITLDSMPGADRSGFAGFNDQVDNHYWRSFGNAFMLSLFSAGIQLSQPRGAVTGTYNSQQIMAAALGQQLGMLGMQQARRNLNMQPTLEIRPGYQFSIMITKDMIVEPWQGHPMGNQKIAVETRY
jgi:type IV secretion system protein VirB10